MPETETQLIERALQELINTKHLYQSIEIDFEPVISASAREAYLRRRPAFRASALTISTGREVPSSLDSIKRELLTELDAKGWMFETEVAVAGAKPIFFSLLPVKTLCSICEDITSFNLWRDSSAHALNMSLGSQGNQLFCLPLQCQGCRSGVIVFMVRRSGRKMQLVGRSEFEQVRVPAFVPKEQKGFYSQALIAFNCGQFLAALFLLRTLIEQHMRAVTGRVELRGDELCDEYNETLDEDFKGRFPSFKDVYRKLSDALHRADPNKTLFKSEIERISYHFEGRDLFARVKKPKRSLSRAPRSAPRVSRKNR